MLNEFYYRVKYLTILAWIISAIISGVLFFVDVYFLIALVVFLILGLGLTYLFVLLSVNHENNKVYITKDIKKMVKTMNYTLDYSDDFVFVNVVDMLNPDAKSSSIAKIVLFDYVGGKKKKKYTYYIDQEEDVKNGMLKTICEDENIKLTSFSSFEEELEKIRNGRSIVIFNLSMLTKLLHKTKNVSLYDNGIVLGERMNFSSKYKAYIPYIASINQNNGLVEDKSDIMVDVYLSMKNDKDIVVKDLLGLEVK